MLNVKMNKNDNFIYQLQKCISNNSNNKLNNYCNNIDNTINNYNYCNGELYFNHFIFYKNNNILTDLDLEIIYNEFISKIEIKDKIICKFKTFENCFIGSDACNLFLEILQSSKIIKNKFQNLEKKELLNLAIHLGNYFLTIGKFEHVCKENCFKNSNLLLYQFTKLEENIKFGNIDFSNIEIPKTPNWYLIYPNIDTNDKFKCTIPITIFSPIFYNLNLKDLKNILFLEILPKEENIELIERNENLEKYTFLQKLKFQEFPDYITIQLLNINFIHSTIAIYSRSKYGYSDWGSNKERVNDWIMKCLKFCK
ncbi:hypothetical protein ABK040_010879 [Willaertia magna]